MLHHARTKTGTSRLVIAVCICGVVNTVSVAQRITFSVDVQGPTSGSFGNNGQIVDSFYAQEMDGGDILTIGTPDQPLPPGPNLAARGLVPQAPGIVVFGIDQGIPNSRSLGLLGVEIGSRRELEIEIDALSYGRDDGRAVFFSVDEFSHGLGGGVAEQSMRFEAAADIFRGLDGPDASVLAIDGAGGESPTRALGLGLIEPNPPDTLEFDAGDNLDALDVNTVDADLVGPIFFSLDAAFADPLEELNPPQGPNIGSAQQNGLSGADILVSMPSQPAQIFLQAQQLGLDPLADDLDALALTDVALDGVFDPSEDQVLYSVRRGSQIIGQIDSALGLPIAPADILTLPLEPNRPPAILIPAEAFGLNANRDLGLIAPIADPHPDDLDALSLGLQDGDMNCNYEWDPEDVAAFALALESSAKYETEFFDDCFGPAELHGDLNMDGRFGFQDIEDFVRVISNSGTLDQGQVEGILARTVPEPATILLSFWIFTVLACRMPRSTST